MYASATCFQASSRGTLFPEFMVARLPVPLLLPGVSLPTIRDGLALDWHY